MTKAVKKEEKIETQIATRNVDIKKLLKEATGTVVVLDKEDVAKKLNDLVKAKKKRLAELIAVPILDKKQLEELKGIRAEFRENRYALQNVDKHNVSALNLAKKNNGAMLDELKLIIEPSETTADTKIKAEELRIENEKEAERLKEKERTDAIELKLKTAGEFLEEELEVARKSNDWAKFDEFYTKFEEELEELQEFEFEGTELLEKYKDKKDGIVELLKQAEDQKETAGELQKKEEDLQKKQDEITENKRRMVEMFGIGFLFNGVEFFQGEEKFTEETVNGKTLEEFTAFVKVFKDKAEALTKYNNTIEEAKGLGMDVEKYTGVEMKETLDTDLDIFKTNKANEDAEEVKKKAEARALILKTEGKLVCDALAVKIEEMEGAVLQYELDSEVETYARLFLINLNKEFLLLKDLLNQTEPEAGE